MTIKLRDHGRIVTYATAEEAWAAIQASAKRKYPERFTDEWCKPRRSVRSTEPSTSESSGTHRPDDIPEAGVDGSVLRTGGDEMPL